MLGGVTGAVAGLATVTPAAGYVSTLSAIAIGVLAGLVCHLALRLKTIFRYDDALDVIAVHFVGGVLGSLLVGFFGEKEINSIGADGIFFGGGAGLLGDQVLALVCVIAFSFVLTWVIAMLIDKTIGLRVDPADEDHLDEVQQGMQAYHDSEVAQSSGSSVTATVPLSSESSAVDVQLITAVVDLAVVEDPGLDEALVAAGALRVLVTETQQFSVGARPRVVRGERRDVSASARFRLEVVAPAAAVPAVVAALRARMTNPVDVFVQPITAAPTA